MSESRSASYEQFLARYERLKADYFSPKSIHVQVDEDNEPLPSCHMSRAQIENAFTNELKVQIPSHRQDPPRFFDGTVGPAYVSKRQDIQMPQAPQSPVQDSIPEGSAKPKQAKQIFCPVHGKSLAILMDDDLFMCVVCYKLTETDSITDEKSQDQF